MVNGLVKMNGGIFVVGRTQLWGITFSGRTRGAAGSSGSTENLGGDRRQMRAWRWCGTAVNCNLMFSLAGRPQTGKPPTSWRRGIWRDGFAKSKLVRACELSNARPLPLRLPCARASQVPVSVLSRFVLTCDDIICPVAFHGLPAVFQPHHTHHNSPTNRPTVRQADHPHTCRRPTA